MELNAEINRVIGTEMARLMSEKIGEEEMTQKVSEVWEKMNKRDYEYGRFKDSDIETYVRNEIIKRLYAKIDAILHEPVNEQAMEKKAREMVDAARKAGEEAIIKSLAIHMANTTLSAYNSHERVVEDVLAQLRMEANRQRY